MRRIGAIDGGVVRTRRPRAPTRHGVSWRTVIATSGPPGPSPLPRQAATTPSHDRLRPSSEPAPCPAARRSTRLRPATPCGTVPLDPRHDRASRPEANTVPLEPAARSLGTAPRQHGRKRPHPTGRFTTLQDTRASRTLTPQRRPPISHPQPASEPVPPATPCARTLPTERTVVAGPPSVTSKERRHCSDRPDAPL